MSMLARFAASGGVVQYKSIELVESGATLQNTDAITFSTALKQNDVVIAFLGTSGGTYTIPAGYILGGNGTITTGYAYAWYYKVMGSTPDTGIDINSNDSDGTGFTYYVFRNVDTSSPIMASATASGSDNPPAVVTTRKSAVIATVFGGNGSTALYSAPPTGYTDFRTVDATANSDTFTASAIKYVASATTEDPGSFTRSGTFVGTVTVTVALNPATGSDITTPTFISSSSRGNQGTSTTVLVPSDIQNGDLLVAIGFIRGGGYITTLPNGFKLISNQFVNADSVANVFVATKIVANDSGSYDFVKSAEGETGISILAYRNATRVNTIGVKYSPPGSVATMVAPEISPTQTGILVASFFLSDGSKDVATPPPNMTQRGLSATGSGGKIAVYDEIHPAFTTGTRSLTWTASSDGSALLLQVTSEPDVEPELVGASHSQYSATGTSLVIDKPYETIEGDLMLAFCTNSGGVSAWTGPAGWTEVADITNGRPITGVYYKVAGASETGPYTFTAGTSRILSGAILTYRYAAYASIGTAASGASPLSLPSITTLYSQSKLIAAAGRDAISITIPPALSMQNIVTNNDAIGQSYVVCDIPVAKGPSGRRTFTVGSTTNVNGIMAAIRPSGATKAAAPALTALSYITATVATAPVLTSTILVPYNVQAGDLLVWSEYTPNYDTGAVPTGFTQLADTTASAVRHRTAYKIATGSEAGTVITGTTGTSGRPVAILSVFRGSTPFVSASTGTWNSEGLNDGDPAQQTVIPPGSGLVLVLAATGARNALANIAFTTQSPSFDRVISHVSPGQDGLSVGYKIYTSGGSTHTIDVADSGTRNTLHSGYLQLTT